MQVGVVLPPRQTESYSCLVITGELSSRKKSGWGRSQKFKSIIQLASSVFPLSHTAFFFLFLEDGVGRYKIKELPDPVLYLECQALYSVESLVLYSREPIFSSSQVSLI